MKTNRRGFIATAMAAIGYAAVPKPVKALMPPIESWSTEYVMGIDYAVASKSWVIIYRYLDSGNWTVVAACPIEEAKEVWDNTKLKLNECIIQTGYDPETGCSDIDPWYFMGMESRDEFLPIGTEKPIQNLAFTYPYNRPFRSDCQGDRTLSCRC